MVLYVKGRKRFKKKRKRKRERVTERRQWSNGVEGRGGALIVSRKMV